MFRSIFIFFIILYIIDFSIKCIEKFSDNYGYFFYISNNYKINCTYDLENKKVGYINDNDLKFIYALIYGHRQNIDKISFIKININQLHKVDCLITLIISDNKSLLDNKNYYVYGFEDMDIHRIRFFYPEIEEYYGQTKSFFINNETLRLEKNSKNILIPRMKIIENFIDFQFKLEDDSNNKQYTCFNEPLNLNKMSCNSPYDPFGNPKKHFTIWDKMCINNSDCDFFKSNKNYPNERGGCIIKENEEFGICEFPIGIKKLGFTKYYKEGRYKPFCYGCTIDKSNNCCQNQTDPDYAFKNDQLERKKYNK